MARNCPCEKSWKEPESASWWPVPKSKTASFESVRPMNGPDLKPTSVASGSVQEDRIITCSISGKRAKVGNVAGSAGGTVGS